MIGERCGDGVVRYAEFICPHCEEGGPILVPAWQTFRLRCPRACGAEFVQRATNFYHRPRLTFVGAGDGMPALERVKQVGGVMQQYAYA